MGSAPVEFRRDPRKASKIMQIYLELSGHPKANIQRVALTGDTVIGRSKKCGLQIASPSVSRKHCQIRLTEKRVTVTDLGSANGTFLNAGRLNAGEEYSLFEGARLNIGGIRFLVSFKEQAVESAGGGPTEDETGTHAALAVGATAVAVGTLAEDASPVEEEEFLLSDSDDLAVPHELEMSAEEEPLRVSDEMLLDQEAVEDAPIVSDEAASEESEEEVRDEDVVASEFDAEDLDAELAFDDEPVLAAEENFGTSDAILGGDADDNPLGEDSLIEEGSLLEEESLLEDDDLLEEAEEDEALDDEGEAILADDDEFGVDDELAIADDGASLGGDELLADDGLLAEDDLLAEDEEAELDPSPALTESAEIEATPDEAMLASDDELLFDDEDAAESGASRLVFGDTTPPVEPYAASDDDLEFLEDEPIAEEESLEDDEELLGTEEALVGEEEDEPILASDEPILGYDEDEDLANSFLSDSDVNLGGSAPMGATVEANLMGGDEDDDDFEVGAAEDDLLLEADEEDVIVEGEASEFEEADFDEEEEVFDIADEEEEAPLAEERSAPPAAAPQKDEPILASDDEDQAFAFLDDDEPPARDKPNDSQLGDFLSQLGRD